MGFLNKFGKGIPSALKLRQHYLHVPNELEEFGDNIYIYLCLRVSFPVFLLLFLSSFTFSFPIKQQLIVICKIFVCLISVFKLSLNYLSSLVEVK